MRARNMTFCTLAGRGGGTLGLKTPRGILDVAQASRLFRIQAPTDIHAVIEGADCAPLKKLAEKALVDKRGRSVLIPESRARFAPAVPRPAVPRCHPSPHWSSPARWRRRSAPVSFRRSARW